MAQDVGMVWMCWWCRSHLDWLVFEGHIPTCACFHSKNFFVMTISIAMHYLSTRSQRSCFSSSRKQEEEEGPLVVVICYVMSDDIRYGCRNFNIRISFQIQVDSLLSVDQGQEYMQHIPLRSWLRNMAIHKKKRFTLGIARVPNPLIIWKWGLHDLGRTARVRVRLDSGTGIWASCNTKLSPIKK